MLANSTLRRSRRKRTDSPEKPYPEFPLRPHVTGYWTKKIRGRSVYFGRWAKRENGKLICLPHGGNWKAALKDYNARIHDLQAGRLSRVQACDPNGLTLAGLCNRFLLAKIRQMECGELSPRTFREYNEATDLLIAKFSKQRQVEDLRPQDFGELRASMARRWGPLRLKKFVQMIRTVFKYGSDDGLMEKPIRFGSSFKKPSKRVMRKNKAAHGKKLFTVAELRMILNALDGKQVRVTTKSGTTSTVKLNANSQLRSIVLIALNGGLGNSDISGLQFRNIDLKTAWLDYPRPKTGLPRRVPLWKETVSALRAHIATRRDAKHEYDAECVFVNRAGRRMVQEHVTEERDMSGVTKVKAWGQDYVSSQFRELLRTLKINGRQGLGFYSLRHTFATIGLQAGDRDAVRAIMGHVAGDMLDEYDATGPSDDRLTTVVEYVRCWLFGAALALSD